MRHFILMAVLSVELFAGAAVSAQTPTNPVLAAPANANPPTTSPPPGELNSAISGMQQTIVSLLLPYIPHEYKNDKQWGQTAAVFDGWKVEREGLKVETRRRWKTVNHGTWKRYEMHIVDPKNDLQLSISNYRESEAGMQFDFNCDVKLHIFGRLSQWNHGVQLISISAEADASLRLRMGCQLGLQLDPSKFPPDILLVPKITDAKLELTNFRLQRVSELHGPVVKQLGTWVREILEDKIAEQDEKLPLKLNAAIDKKKDKLRLSIRDLVSTPWGDLSRFTNAAVPLNKNAAPPNTNAVPSP